MTVGFFSPLPPARTGVADYSAALLAALRRIGSVRENAEGGVNLYHLGNNQLHRGIYEHAIRTPGVIVLHDAVLHHFFLGALAERDYIDEFVYNYGEWSRTYAARLWRNRSRSGGDASYFRYPMLRRAVERARAVIVHNPAAADIVSAACAGSRPVEIPHLFSPPVPVETWRSERLRAAWNLRPSTTLYAVFGHLRESKRITTVIKAFGELRRRAPNVCLLLAGEVASSDLALALPAGEPGVIRTGYLEDCDFWTAAQAADVCINLRYPPAGETSGIGIRLMGIGKPVIVTSSKESARIPETACLRIDPGAGECDALIEAMQMLTLFPELRHSIGRAAAAHIQREHAVQKAAVRYWETLAGAV